MNVNTRRPLSAAAHARNVLAAVLAAALLAGCVGPTPYGPATDGKGYAEQRLETNRYRVSFTGNSKTPRSTVETYLLYRAAEITLQTGHDYFRIVDQDVEEKTAYNSTVSVFDTGLRPFRYGARTHSSGIGIGTLRPVTSYEAIANIVVATGEKPEQDDQAYSAREVILTLGPAIRRTQRSAAN